ncbi:MAG TPA: hypothetical protein VJR89_21960 [Polyangiales bacterium]|nr:hypothetical protein [Polyangiales bacterium]
MKSRSLHTIGILLCMAPACSGDAEQQAPTASAGVAAPSGAGGADANAASGNGGSGASGGTEAGSGGRGMSSTAAARSSGRSMPIGGSGPAADGGAPAGASDGSAGSPSAGAGGAAGLPAAAGAGAGGAQSVAERTLPAVTSVDMDGPFAVTIDQRGGASSWVFRPTELGKDGAKHPVFVFGNGAGGSPSFYMAQMRRIASHGIIVVHPTAAMVNAGTMKAALDWILAENMRMDSIYFQKLNGKAAMGGHSLGSLATFDQEAMETRLTTTLHIAGGSMDRSGSAKVKTPTAYICGDTDLARENCENDFADVKSQPTFLSILDGTDHIPAVGRALPGMVAWLRWHLAGETERKAQFTCPDGDFCKGIWHSQTKNW